MALSKEKRLMAQRERMKKHRAALSGPALALYLSKKREYMRLKRTAMSHDERLLCRVRHRIFARESYARHAERYRERSRLWCHEHPSENRAKRARRVARLLRATPLWGNRFFVDEIYDLAQFRTRALGFPWHVDHIIPLRNPLVCGLHVENNLRVIPWQENLCKSNRLEVALLGNTR